LGHQTCENIISKITYIVSIGMLNLTQLDLLWIHGTLFSRRHSAVFSLMMTSLSLTMCPGSAWSGFHLRLGVWQRRRVPWQLQLWRLH